ncbi:hypothetical protein VNO80_25575 [Phaseolus coccineus]|uniref:Uncharacterized protein n=1 Tax=Phaseolus coccineus TaxID=3886 RepID=A0AAN9QNV6_PHACN
MQNLATSNPSSINLQLPMHPNQASLNSTRRMENLNLHHFLWMNCLVFLANFGASRKTHVEWSSTSLIGLLQRRKRNEIYDLRCAKEFKLEKQGKKAFIRGEFRQKWNMEESGKDT